ncbi:MAG TPA: LegC family aminotransferase [Fimbriimonadaceae bacterium]|nr:LegC family aminotransferase [Fimbriimonadaceae bacterium]HRE93076.1 LegC family aminotransferase [Fimbriimonadaceae bacterium]
MSGGTSIPLCVPNLGGREAEYVQECFATGWVSTAGPFVDRFEREFAAAVGAPYAVAMMNGTAALHIAMLVAGVRPGDLVVVPTLTFIAPINAITYCQATPLFVDADPHTWQMDAAATVAYIEGLEQREDGAYDPQRNQRVGAILPVHLLGHPVDLSPILASATQKGIPVVEDATESLGALDKEGRAIGTRGQSGCFSFNGNKLITTGGGGMLVTSDPEAAKRARYLSTTAKDEPVEFIHGAVGYNYRLTNIQAAMGVAQLEQLPTFLNRKREVFEFYNEAFKDLAGFTPMPEAEGITSACWLYTALFAPDSRPLLRHLDSLGIQTRPLWQPNHLSPAYLHLGQGPFPVAERLNRESLSLPCSTHITDEHLRRVVDAVSTFWHTL